LNIKPREWGRGYDSWGKKEENHMKKGAKSLKIASFWVINFTFLATPEEK